MTRRKLDHSATRSWELSLKPGDVLDERDVDPFWRCSFCGTYLRDSEPMLLVRHSGFEERYHLLCAAMALINYPDLKNDGTEKDF